MKYLFLLSLSSLLLFGCKHNQGDHSAHDHGDHSGHDHDHDTNSPADHLRFDGKEGAKKIVLIAGDEEYRSEESLPQLARILSKHHGFDCSVLLPQRPDKPGFVDPNYLNNIPGTETLADADLMIIATRFRELPDEQMQHIDDFLMEGKPVIGIRTATHAFNIKDSTSNWVHYGNYHDAPGDPWDGGFGRLVLGEKWHTHHGHHKHQSTHGLIAESAKNHPIATGLSDGDVWGSTDVYGVRLPLPGDAQHIIMGQVMNRPGDFDEADLLFGMRPSDSEVATKAYGDRTYNPNDPLMPVAWTKSYQLPSGKQGRSFTSTVGSSTDFLGEGVRTMYVNAVYWLLGQEVPSDAKVDLVGTFKPTQYTFHKDDEHWTKMNWTLEGIRALD